MIGKELAEWFSNEENMRLFFAELQAMTECNQHTEREILIAHKFGFKDFERKFRNINAVHRDMGYLCKDLLQYRYKLHRAMYERMVWYYGQELADLINLA